MPNIEHTLQQVHEELAFEFVRSSGPGGQNVNKVATAVQLRLDLNRTTALPEAAKQRLARLAGRRQTADGILMIEARRYRTQEQNRADAIARLDELIRRALQEPKRRLPTRASASSHEKRIRAKKRKGEIKRSRRDRSYEP